MVGDICELATQTSLLVWPWGNVKRIQFGVALQAVAFVMKIDRARPWARSQVYGKQVRIIRLLFPAAALATQDGAVLPKGATFAKVLVWAPWQVSPVSAMGLLARVESGPPNKIMLKLRREDTEEDTIKKIACGYPILGALLARLWARLILVNFALLPDSLGAVQAILNKEPEYLAAAVPFELMWKHCSFITALLWALLFHHSIKTR